MRFSPVQRRLAASVIATAALLVTPVLLFAHARLLRSSPAENNRLTASPTSLSFWFSEKPELRFTSIRLLDSAGAPVRLGAPTSLTGDPPGISLAIVGSLPRGRYTVLWRTAGADGHPSSGRYAFEVTSASPPPAIAAPPAVTPPAGTPPVAAAAQTPVSNPVLAPERVVTFSSAMRWAELVAVITTVGAIIFSLVVLPASGWSAALVAEGTERARRLAQSALVLFVITTVLRLLSQSALIAGGSGNRPTLALIVVRDTRWGHGWTVGVVGAIVTAVGLLLARRLVKSGWMTAAVGIVAVCTGEALTGHAAALRHPLVAVSADLAHVLGAGGWVGGLVAILLSGLPSLKAIDTSARAAAGARLVRAYHRTALECVTLVVLSALLAAWLRLGNIGQLVTTDYGRLLLLKVGFVIVVLLFGLFHWQRVVSVDWDADTKFRFQRSATAELVVGAIVIAVTALLVSTPLPE